MQEKVCKICGKSKPITEFYKVLKGKYGVHSTCIKCLLQKFKDERKKKKQEKLITCSMCGETKPSTEFYKYKTKYRTICKTCLHSRYQIPDFIKKIARENNFPSTLLMGWTPTAIECLEIGCNCDKCTLKDTITSSECKMKKAVRLLIQIHGKPDGCNELTVIWQFLRFIVK